jgi:hypothetical protein
MHSSLLNNHPGFPLICGVSPAEGLWNSSTNVLIYGEDLCDDCEVLLFSKVNIKVASAANSSVSIGGHPCRIIQKSTEWIFCELNPPSPAPSDVEQTDKIVDVSFTVSNLTDHCTSCFKFTNKTAPQRSCTANLTAQSSFLDISKCAASLLKNAANEERAEIFLGIDFVDSVTVIAPQLGSSQLLSFPFGSSGFIPNFVFFDPDSQRVIVGREAEELQSFHPESVLHHLHEFIGKKYNQVEEILKKYSFNTKSYPDNSFAFILPNWPEPVTPVEALAHIFRHIKSTITEMGFQLRASVITVPSN